MLFFCFKSALLYHLLSIKCASSVPDAEFADLVHTRLSLSLASGPGVVGGPAHGPQADVVEPGAGSRPPVLVAFSQRKEFPLEASQRSRNGAVVPRWDERQPSKDGGDWHNVDERRLRLIQLLRPAHASLLPPGSCKNQSLVRKLSCAYLTYDNKTLRQMNTCICCIIVCTKSA